MTLTEEIITITVVVLGTMLTRFLPFLIFPSHDRIPPLISFLGRILPPAVMGMLVIYMLKNTELTAPPHGLPEALALLSVVLLQVFVKKLLLTILLSTFFYMCLLQYVFV